MVESGFDWLIEGLLATTMWDDQNDWQFYLIKSFWCLHFSSKKRTKTSQQVVRSNLFIGFLEETLA